MDLQLSVQHSNDFKAASAGFYPLQFRSKSLALYNISSEKILGSLGHFKTILLKQDFFLSKNLIKPEKFTRVSRTFGKLSKLGFVDRLPIRI